MEKDSFIAVRIAKVTHEQLQQKAQEQDLSVGWIVRKAITNYLQQEDNTIQENLSIKEKKSKVIKSKE